MRTTKCQHRRAMTLVELLVVMVIMLVLATIVVAFAPGFQDAQKVARGADQLQMWLVSARQTAKSARIPSGLRLISVNGKVNEMLYIQQPSQFSIPFAVPAQASGQQQTALLGISPGAGGVSTVTLNMPTTSSSPALAAGQIPGDFSGGQGVNSDRTAWPVQPGDYLVIHGTVCCIATSGVAATAIGPAYPPSYANLCNQLTLVTPLTDNLATIPATSDYYFVRAARPLTGETSLKLPQDVAIDLNQGLPSSSTSGTFDILFSPSGEVLSSSLNNKIIFWVLDVTKPAGNAQDTLIAIDIRTGQVAAQPVGPSGSPFLYTTDGKSSGL